MKQLFPKIVQFFTVGIWRIRLGKLSPGKSFLIRSVRIALLAFRRYDEDKCLLRASALTFYSLLAIVPVLAVAFGIAKGFGFEKILEQQLLEKFPTQRAALEQAIPFVHSLLANTQGGLVAGVGVVVLLWSIIKVLGTIEKSFNDIWGIKSGRPFVRKLSDYLAVVFICPVLLVIASGVTVFIGTQVRFVTAQVPLLGTLSPFIFLVLKILPYAVLWVLFTFMYMFMPNTKVRFSSGLTAGIAAGTVYQVVQWAYVTFQIGAAHYNAVYGTFAALPLFLVWLQVSWLIVLAGAEVSFAHQNIEMYEFEPDCLDIKPAHKKLISLLVMRLIVRNFEQNTHPFTSVQIAGELDIPIRLARQVVYELVECGLIDEITTHTYKEAAYQPAHDPQILSISYVVSALENKGGVLEPAQGEALSCLSRSLQEMNALMEKSPENKLLKDI